MYELARINKMIEDDIDEIQKNGAQPERVSLDLICCSLMAIAQELAIMNDTDTRVAKAVNYAKEAKKDMDEEEGSIMYSGMWEELVNILYGEKDD